MTSSGSRARSGLSCSCPRFCTTDLPFRREHARPERQAPVRPVCPVGLYRAHIRIRLVALPEALPRRGGVRPVVRARRFHGRNRSEEHTSELQSLTNLVCRLLLEKKKKKNSQCTPFLLLYYR